MELDYKNLSYSNDEHANQILAIETERDYPVYKDNALVRMCYDLSNLEQKIMSFIVSKINPNQPKDEYQISIRDYLQVAGMHDDSGQNYVNVKKSIQQLANESIWVEIEENGKKGEKLERFLDDVRIFKNSGVIKFRLGSYMIPYLTELDCFIKYSLRYVLAFKGRYTIHLYEILKSYEYVRKTEISIDNLKKVLLTGRKGRAASYEKTHDFKKRVLEPSLEEINMFSDISVQVEYVKCGKSIVSCVFRIHRKNTSELLSTNAHISEEIDTYLDRDQIKGQMDITDFIEAPACDDYEDMIIPEPINVMADS